MWRLDGRASTLLLLSRDGGLPEILHWGAHLPDLTETEARCLRARGVASNALDADVPFARLLPTSGAGSFGMPGLAAHRWAADWSAEFTLTNVETIDAAIILRARDSVIGVDLLITLRLRPDGDVLEQMADLSVDRAAGALSIDRFAAGTILAPSRARTLMTFGARWGREFAEHYAKLDHGALVIENRRGRTSHDRVPLLIAATEDASEPAGEAWGVHVGWSGNHQLVVERLPDGSLLVSGGALFQPGEGEATPDEPMLSPPMYSAYSGEGLAGLARAFHRHARAHVLRWPGGSMMPRPVTLNTWEGNYFRHDQQRLMDQATAAARLGIERFVLDDGWMKGRNDDTAGLGDWTPDPRKYPQGLAPLAKHVTGLGMQFGLWVEPEMANPDSDALRAMPDAVLLAAGRQLRLARRQVALDLARQDVFEPVFQALDRLLRELPISYLKWDMNRDLDAAGDAYGRAGYDRHVVAVHAMIDRLREAHPRLEIESCASGGGRPDWGMLARTHRVWTSDCTDALERLAIQRGALRFLPPEVLGAHVSASPNHQTGRRHTMTFRCAVALFFHMGVEMDPLSLPEAEFRELADWIALHKRLRPLLHGGDHVALPLEDSRSLLGVVAPDRRAAAYLVAQEAAPLYAIPAPLCLPGLAPDARYRLVAPPPQRPVGRLAELHHALFADGIVLRGAALTQAGFVPPALPPESALVLHATQEEG